jgi:general secretion pathway protein D
VRQTKWLDGISLAALILGYGISGGAQESATPTPAPATIETDEAVVLNFEGADIREVIHSLATALGINYSIDPRVQGQVTIRTTGKIARRDLFPIFHQILRSHGIAATRVGELYQIAPVGEAKTRAPLTDSPARRRSAAAEDRFVIELVKVGHVSAEEMAKVLQPFVSPGGDVIAYPRGNLVIISDLAESVARLKELVVAFDTDTFRELRSQVYHIENANVEDLGDELKGVLEPYGLTPKSAEERGVFIVPLSRLNSIVVVGFNPEVFAQVEKWIQILDVPPEKGGGRTVHVYAVENAKAADLASVLSGLYGGEGGGGAGGRRSTGVEGGRGGGFAGGGVGSSARGEAGGEGTGLGRGGASSRSGTRGGVGGRSGTGGLGETGGRSGRRATGIAGAGFGGEGGGSQTVLIAPKEGEKPIFKEEVRIVADEISNSLIILATARDYEMIKEVLRKLDVVPRQVLIEAIIAEVGLIGDLKFGIEWAIANQGIGSIITGAGSTSGTGDTSDTSGTSGTTASFDVSPLPGTAKRGISVDASGLVSFITDRDTFFVLLTALAARSRVNILSTPHVIAADNREAHILVGEEIPILSSSAVSTISADAPIVNSIQYRDTGKILTILPQVNSAGLVNMEIRQEVSAVGSQAFGDTGSPSFITREAETTVVVQNGESVLIGGIIDDQLRRTRTGVPFLMDIPVLGRLFRVESENLNRTELILLITPYVIRDRQEAQAVTAEFESRIRNLKQMLERVQPPKAAQPPATGR